MNRAVIMWRVASFAVAAGFIALWQLVAHLRLVSPVFLPGPDRAWASLVRGFSTGDLGSKLAGTLEHMAYGWLAASIAGIAIGAIIGSSRTMRTYVAPSLEFLRPLPVSALIPVAIAMLGLTQAMALFVIAFGAIWPIMLATIHGFAAVEPRLAKVVECRFFGGLSEKEISEALGITERTVERDWVKARMLLRRALAD